MKKLMTSTIILLPLLILAIMLVSGAIMSLITHIYVETVEFSENDALILVMSDENDPPEYDLSPEVTILPLKATNRGLKYTIEDESLVTVNDKGVVTAVFYGETYVTVASTENRAAVAKRKVIVTDKSVHEIRMNEGYETQMYEGETQTLSVTVYPKEAENKTIIWKSSDESILTVSANGTVTSVGAGKATVTAVSDDNGEAWDSVEITCHKKILDLEVDRTSVVTALKTQKFPTVTPVPADADVTLSYRVSDPAVASVDGQGNITFKKQGHVTVTVTAEDFRGKTVEKQKEYTSTDGYYLPPLFEQKEYTVDYDEYHDGDLALPVPFATKLAQSYREYLEVKYSVDNVLEFDETTKQFRFKGPMPVGNKTLRVEVKARIYQTEDAELVEYDDYFVLNVLRDAKSIAVSFGGTSDVATIVTALRTFTLGPSAGVGVSVEPANHTNTLSFALDGGADVASVTETGVLTFKKAGAVTVKIVCAADGAVKAEKVLRVVYAPAAANEKSVTVLSDSGAQKLLLSMESDAQKQAGVIYFAEPAVGNVSYTVEGAAVTLSEENGARRIVPQEGGFATVRIAAGQKTYSIEVFVDLPVVLEDLTSLLGGSSEDRFGTKENEVSFSAAVAEEKNSMAGKQIYVSYGNAKQTGDEGKASFGGKIPFVGLSTLSVTFGVGYSSRAKEFGVREAALAPVTRTATILRDAKSISVFYGGTQTDAVQTSSGSVTFTTVAAEDAYHVFVKAEPANHTDTIVYSLAAGGEYGSVTAGGVLTIKDAESPATVSVKIELKNWKNQTVLEKVVAVNYAPPKPENKVIDLNTATSPKVLLTMRGSAADKGEIHLTVPVGSTAEYKVVKGDAVTIAEEGGYHYIVPQKGGFATVKVTVSDAARTAAEYTIELYVDRSVSPQDLTVKFGDRADSLQTLGREGYFGTKGTEVFFSADQNGAAGCMEGKKLYVSTDAAPQRVYNTENVSLFSGKVSFPKTKNTLSVTFGVEYTDEAKAFGVLQELSFTVRTLKRNAESVTVLYGGVQTAKIHTQNRMLLFTTDETKLEPLYAVVKVAPETHTDTLGYELIDENNVAKFEYGVLTFRSAGSVTVKAYYEDENGDVTAEKSVTVVYTPIEAAGENEPKKEAVVVGGTDESGKPNEPPKVALSITPKETAGEPGPSGPEEKTEGVIFFTEPENTTVTYTVIAEPSQSDASNPAVEIVEDEDTGTRRIVPLRGGFATIRITVTEEDPNAVAGIMTVAARAAEQIYEFEVYVDRPVSEEDYAVQLNKIDWKGGEFVTSKEALEYFVKLSDKEGSTEGKYLSLSYGGETENNFNGFEWRGQIEFGADNYTVRFSVGYTEKASSFVDENAASGNAWFEFKIRSTHGRLEETPTVTAQDGAPLKTREDNLIELPDIGESVTLTVDTNSFSPADFELTKAKVRLEGTGNIGVEISADGSRITLKANNPCPNGEVMTLSVGNYTFTLNVKAYAKAQKLTMSYGETALESLTAYNTFLDSLDFYVQLGRDDGKVISNTNVQYKIGGGTWSDPVPAGSVTVKLTSNDVNELTFCSADGGAEYSVSITKRLLEDFTMQFSFSNTEGKPIVLDTIDATNWPASRTYQLPSAMQGHVTITVTPKNTDLLGGFGTAETFGNIFKVTPESGWSVGYTPSSNQAVISGTFSGQYQKNVGIKPNGKGALSVTFSHFDLERIEFTGFDMENKANGGDVYKGYQQVRVFAKQSTYRTGDNSTADVDYFKMPVAAYAKIEPLTKLENVSWLSWNLVAHNDKTNTETTIASQVGYTVTYDGKQYTIAETETGSGKYVLKQGETIVVGENGKYVEGQPHVTWVDPFSEEGYVRIYFGGFTGLSETDIQNDYFGNFAEEEGWTTPKEQYALNGSGPVQPSAGAFSYLSVEATDGAVGGVSRHFNFNVLEGSDLFNIFDATGYLSGHKEIVLQNSLYGPGELDGTENTEKKKQAEDNDLFLDDETEESFTSDTWGSEKAPYEKTLIYGNGYQINLKTVNDAINTKSTSSSGGMLNNGKENTAYGLTFGPLYNLTLKGTTEADSVNCIANRIIFNMQKIYYSTVECYSKIVTSTTYVRNSVLRYVANCALQIWGATQQAQKNLYLENVVFAESLRAVSVESCNPYVNVYIKGSFDLLSYYNAKGMRDAYGGINDGGLGYSSSFTEANITTSQVKSFLEWFGRDGSKGTEEYRYYVNMGIVTDPFSFCTVQYWDENNQKYITSHVEGSNLYLSKKAVMNDFMSPQVYLYNTSYYGTDGGNASSLADRDMTKLFNPQRDIRLLCQYIDVKNDGTSLIKNSEHIQWHINRVYRDRSIVGDEADHIAALKQSLINATNSETWDGVWPDGTTLQNALDAVPADVAALAEMVSTSVLPPKRTY